MTRDTTALAEVLDAVTATAHPSPDGLRRIRDLIQARTAAQVAPWAAARQAVYLEGRTAMTSSIPHHEDISVLGKGVIHHPLSGRPEYKGLIDTADGPQALIEDGDLSLRFDDLETIQRWRKQLDRAAIQLGMRMEKTAAREKREGRS